MAHVGLKKEKDWGKKGKEIKKSPLFLKGSLKIEKMVNTVKKWSAEKQVA